MYISKSSKEELKGYDPKVIKRLLERGLIIEIKEDKPTKKEDKKILSTKEDKVVKTTKKVKK